MMSKYQITRSYVYRLRRQIDSIKQAIASESPVSDKGDAKWMS